MGQVAWNKGIPMKEEIKEKLSVIKKKNWANQYSASKTIQKKRNKK
jgi:hypothetical protein